MRQFIILLILSISFSGCGQEPEIVTFKIDENIYETSIGNAFEIKKDDISFSVKRINESAKKRYEFMSKTLDFMDDFSKEYISEIDAYLISGTKTFGEDKTYLYHFFKNVNGKQGISILVICPFDEDQKYKVEIFRVVQSTHF